MQIIHRSVGEPAEGSLTRYPRINQWEPVFALSSWEWIGTCLELLNGMLCVRLYSLLTGRRNTFRRQLDFRLGSPLTVRVSIHWLFRWELILTHFTPFLLVDFYMLSQRGTLVLAGTHVYYLNVKITTLSNGYLGSRNDEERSEMRYVMRIAEFSESSNLWTQIALLGSPRSTPLSVSVQQSLSSVFVKIYFRRCVLAG